MPGVEPYIEKRLRRPSPTNCNVITGSTPVISFGSVLTAKVATLGLNPSRVEFLDGNGTELVGSKRRLATYASLKIADLQTAKTGQLRKIIEECYGYFKRNPYRKWFDSLEGVLNACGASYYNSTACHLDLVQWATNPTWSRLMSSVRARLLDEDLWFLKEQLRSARIKLLLVNGIAVTKSLKTALNCRLTERKSLVLNGIQKSRIHSGKLSSGIHVISWSINLQSSYGVTTELRRQLANRIGRMAKTWASNS